MFVNRSERKKNRMHTNIFVAVQKVSDTFWTSPFMLIVVCSTIVAQLYLSIYDILGIYGIFWPFVAFVTLFNHIHFLTFEP